MLNEILESSNEYSFYNQWPGVSQSTDSQTEENVLESLQSSSQGSCFLPSQLLDMNTPCSSQASMKGNYYFCTIILRL